MKRKTTIQKRIAFFLLLLFTISMAPKLYFHDALAGHKDESYCHHLNQSSFCLHQQGFNCHFDTLVVTAPYVFFSEVLSFNPDAYGIIVSSIYQQGYTSCFKPHRKSRGPPAGSV